MPVENQDMVVYNDNPSSQGAEKEGSWVQSQMVLHSEDFSQKKIYLWNINFHSRNLWKPIHGEIWQLSLYRYRVQITR